MIKKNRNLFVTIFLCGFLLLVSGENTNAAIFTVTRNDDRDLTCNSGADCSLREAITAANATAGDDTIVFNFASLTTITLNSEISITSNISINGPGLNSYSLANNLIISGNNSTRLFSIPSAAMVSIGGLTLTGGQINDHGAVIYKTAVGSNLILNYVKITNNTAFTGNGGAIANFQGSLTILNSTFNGNTAGRDGGGIYFEGDTLKIQNSTFNNNTANDNLDFGGGAVYTEDPTIISNSTFSGNSAMLSGGAVYFAPGNGLSALTIRNSTVAGNTAQFAGGVFNDGGTLNLYNSIVALNTASSFANIFGSVTTGSNNITSGTPALDPLADNGGPTQTRALPAGSTAINAGSNAQALDVNGLALTTDQRGQGSARISNGTVDVGAFEFGSAPAQIFLVTRNDDRNLVCNPGVDCSLREAVALANATAGDQTINFVPSLSGQTITLVNQINITGNVNIQGLGTGNLTISGNNTTRLFSIIVPVTTTIGGLTLTKGRTGDSGGTILQNAVGASLTLDTVNVTDSTATTGSEGGGVTSFHGSLTVLNSTFRGNTARNGGAIYYEGGGELKVQSSTFYNNTSSQTGDFGGGAIFAGYTATVSNSTFYNNTAAFGGGGIYFLGAGAIVLTVRNSTFTQNTARFAGGVLSSGGITNLANSIVSKNNNSAGGSFPNIYNDASLNNLGGNLIDNANPMLAPLSLYGGPTPTVGLLAGSPALNIGVNAQALDVNGQSLVTDQRGAGFTRFNGTVDSGAFEGTVVLSPTAATVKISGIVRAPNGSGVSKAYVYLTDSDGQTRRTLTNQFGNFQFTDLTAGNIYIMNITHKIYEFNPQIIPVMDNIEDLIILPVQDEVKVDNSSKPVDYKVKTNSRDSFRVKEK